MTKSLTIYAWALLATVLLLSNGSAARRLRTNPNRGRYSTAAPVIEEEVSAGTSASSPAERISVDPLETSKFSFSDPAADKFKTTHESDRKSFGASSGVNSPFADVGTSTSSFGKGLRKRKPSYQISEESQEEPSNHDSSSYEVNYKTTVTHKPGPSFDSGSFKFSSVTGAPVTKSKFGSSGKFSSYSSLHGGSSGQSSAPAGIFKFNEPASSSGSHSSGAITTKFAINHPAPTHSAANLGGSYQTFSDESFGGSSGQLTEKFIKDYHSTLSKLKPKESDKPKIHNSSPFKTKFTSDTSNFKVSSDFKVAAESHQSPFQNTKTKFGSEFSSFKPTFKLQEVPNLYPSEDQFRPSVGYPGGPAGGHSSASSDNQLFEPNSDNDDYLQQQLAKNPASRGQYQQYLKSKEDEKIEQQALLEQYKYQQQKPKAPPPKAPISRPPQTFTGASTKYRPYITVKKNFIRRKPLVRVSSSPGLSHYRTPVIDGPYTIHFSV